MSMFSNLAQTVSRLGVRFPVTLMTPASAGQYGTDGRWIDSAYVTTTLLGASIQRASGEDLKLLPEGLRTEEVFKIFSPVALTPTHKDGVRGHRIQYQGATYEIKQSSDRSDNGAYWSALAVKVDF